MNITLLAHIRSDISLIYATEQEKMAFCCRIKQSQLKCLSNQLKRRYFQVDGPSMAIHIDPLCKIGILDKPNLFTPRNQFELRNHVRFFAAPVQVKQKQEEKDTSGVRLNGQITAEYVRLVTDEGHGIVSRREALERARRLNLDLVEVQRNAKPPVCKLMDYNKERYKQQVKEKDRGKSKSDMTLRKGDCKEVRFAGKIEQKDLQMKADMAKRLMERGYRVKCTAMGSDDQDLGGLLSRLLPLIEDVSVVESGPRVEKRQAYVVVRHIKFGPSKKGSGKKASKSGEATTSDFENVGVSSSSTDTMQFKENSDDAESGLETEDGILSDESLFPPSLEAPETKERRSTWSVADKSDDFNEVFDFGDDANGFTKSSSREQMKTEPSVSSHPAKSSSEYMDARPTIDSTRTLAVSSSLSEAPHGTENRYRREASNKFPPTTASAAKGPGAGDARRPLAQFPDQGRQQRFEKTASPPRRETEQGGNKSFSFRHLNLPPDEKPPYQDPSSHSNSPRSSAPNYGIFSVPKTDITPGNRSVPTEVNRYKKGSPCSSTQNPSPVGLSADRNSHTSNSNVSGRAGVVDEDGQGRWNRFTRESSNVIPNRNSEWPAKARR